MCEEALCKVLEGPTTHFMACFYVHIDGLPLRFERLYASNIRSLPCVSLALRSADAAPPTLPAAACKTTLPVTMKCLAYNVKRSSTISYSNLAESHQKQHHSYSTATLPDGYILPAGTNVSMNPWVINRHPLFGDAVDDFIPERWLQQPREAEAEYQKRIGQMKRADLVFGGGVRACTGRYVSFLEMYKLIPTLLMEYEIGLVDEAED